jgi:hypothetical protein
VASNTPADSLEIRSVTVNGEPVKWRENGDVSVGASAENISITFAARTNVERSPVRIRYKLEGYDNNWRDGSGDRYLMVCFYNAEGDQIALKNFRVEGDSPDGIALWLFLHSRTGGKRSSRPRTRHACG